MEGEVGLRTLFERYPDLRVERGAVRRGTRILRGYEHLPVTLSPSVRRRPAGRRPPARRRTAPARRARSAPGRRSPAARRRRPARSGPGRRRGPSRLEVELVEQLGRACSRRTGRRTPSTTTSPRRATCSLATVRDRQLVHGVDHAGDLLARGVAGSGRPPAPARPGPRPAGRPRASWGRCSVSMTIRLRRRTAKVPPLPTVSPISPSNCLSAAPITFEAALVPNDISEPEPGHLVGDRLVGLQHLADDAAHEPRGHRADQRAVGQPLQRPLEHRGQGQQLVEERLDPLAVDELPQRVAARRVRRTPPWWRARRCR